jgi:hypothetical protein
MKIQSTGFVEHRSEGEQDLPRLMFVTGELLMPGACTSCSWGCGCSSSCSCCGAIALSE